MKLVHNPIKSTDENICGASFSYSGIPAKSEVAYATQPLTFSAFADQQRASNISGVFVLAPDAGTATIQLDARTVVSYTVVETYDGATLINASVSLVIIQEGSQVFSKQYSFKEYDLAAQLVDTQEAGTYTGGGFSITLPTKLSEGYTCKIANKLFKNYHCNIDFSMAHAGQCLVKCSIRLDFALENKSAGFTTSEHNAIVTALLAHESKKDFMYVDTKGNVTTGIGFILPTESAAASYPFLTFDDAPATDEQKRAEWRLINSHYSSTVKHTADWYEDFTTLYLTDEFIGDKLVEIVDDTFTGLNARISGFGGFPSAVRIALQDMAYNVGAKGLVQKFPRLVTAIELRDWATAAEESHRADLGDDRNNYVRDLFLSAVSH